MAIFISLLPRQALRFREVKQPVPCETCCKTQLGFKSCPLRVKRQALSALYKEPTALPSRWLPQHYCQVNECHSHLVQVRVRDDRATLHSHYCAQLLASCWRFVGTHWYLLNLIESYQACARGKYDAVDSTQTWNDVPGPEHQLLIVWFGSPQSLWDSVSSSVTRYLVLFSWRWEEARRWMKHQPPCPACTGHKTKSGFFYSSLSPLMLILKVTLGDECPLKPKLSSNPELPCISSIPGCILSGLKPLMIPLIGLNKLICPWRCFHNTSKGKQRVEQFTLWIWLMSTGNLDSWGPNAQFFPFPSWQDWFWPESSE